MHASIVVWSRTKHLAKVRPQPRQLMTAAAAYSYHVVSSPPPSSL